MVKFGGCRFPRSANRPRLPRYNHLERQDLAWSETQTREEIEDLKLDDSSFVLYVVHSLIFRRSTPYDDILPARVQYTVVENSGFILSQCTGVLWKYEVATPPHLSTNSGSSLQANNNIEQFWCWVYTPKPTFLRHPTATAAQRIVLAQEAEKDRATIQNLVH